MLKRLYSGLLAILMLFGACLTVYAGGGDDTDYSFADAWAAYAPAENEVALQERLMCTSAILVERSSGQVLYEKDADKPLPPASITKVMTLLLVMEAMERGDFTLDTIVTASEHACEMGGSQIWLEPGEQMTVDDLLKATAIQSANDAAVALAELVGGSEEGFVDLMNARAAELGMINTTFQNASGLDADGHLTSARDIALMSCELLKHDLIREYVGTWMASLRNGETELTNTNKLLKSYSGTTGLKTGTTDGAGRCLSASAVRDGMELVAVTLGSASSDERFSSVKALLDYGFGHWQLVQPKSVEHQLGIIPVRHGVLKQVLIEEGEIPTLLLEKSQAGKVTTEVTLAEELEAPVEKGQSVGKAILKAGGEVVGEYDIIASEDVGRMDFLTSLGMLFKAVFSF